MKPTLQYGSSGPAVSELQAILNKIQSALGAIAVDGKFGNQTRVRVLDFQTKRHITADGIVGPATWAHLQGGSAAGSGNGVAGANAAGPNGAGPAAANATIPGAGPDAAAGPAAEMPGNEAAARERIIQIALQDFAKHGGWKPGDKPSPNDPRVAGKLCADAATRLRQGGKKIMEIFTVAGGPAPQRCLTITPQAEAMYLGQYSPADRNNKDIVSWCGIFSLYVHKAAGLRSSGWPLKYSIGKAKATDEYRIVTWPKPGDIGVVDPTKLNHHFVVTAVDDSGVQSVDGNAGWYMEIVKKQYSRSEIKSRQGYFLTPVWENVLG